MSFQPCAEECIHRLGRAMRRGAFERGTWAHGFTASLLGQAKRRNWHPSDKQLHAMRRMLAELAEPEGALIDWDDSGEAA
ncbi:MAG: hypothetical protein OEN23_20705 [Paracoccaceae bacterium]|nr:hypothetical protein [Paracoccaceae bacterium]